MFKSATASQTAERQRRGRKKGSHLKCYLGEPIDISPTGISVLCQGQLELKAEEVVNLTLSTGCRQLQLRGQVTEVKRKGLRRHEVAVRFYNMKSGKKEALEAILGKGFYHKPTEKPRPKEESPRRKPAAKESADPYWTLGVPADATMYTIKQAYRTLVRKHHPDVSKDAASERLFREIHEAYSILRDPEQREAYDAEQKRLREADEAYERIHE